MSSKKELKEIKEIIKKLPMEGKLEILSDLEGEFFAFRFKALLEEFRSSAKNYPLMLEEITKEVEIIRKRRHESSN